MCMQVQLLVHTSRKARCGFASKTLSLNCALAHFFNDTFLHPLQLNAFSKLAESALRASPARSGSPGDCNVGTHISAPILTARLT